MESVAELVSCQLLPRVSRPGQYIGLEINSRCPDVRSAEVTVALAYPDAYSVGISHLGSQVLYHMLNDIPGVACDRAYCPFPDAEEVCRKRSIPLFGWESRCRLRDFDILGFSLAYEMCVTNALTMLDLAGIPLRAAERGQGHPLVVAGDALADSPEAVAEFFDIIIPGDGEGPMAELVEIVRQAKRCGASREETILQAARTIRSAYAPQYYQAACLPDGAMTAPAPLRSDLPVRIDRACLERLSDSPAIRRPLVPLAEAVHNRVTIEIMRGCPNACRFCQAGHTRLPVRFRSADEIISIARAALAASGYREISLLSLSSGDYPHLEELIERLNAEFADRRVSVSLPSLRVDRRLRQLPALTSVVRKGGLTIAAEAGSVRLRAAIGKDISDEDMIAGVRAAYQAGWQRVKVYFMAGLPGETDADIDAIYDLCRRLSEVRRDIDARRGAISASVSWFVPKPHTPMQWCAMRDGGYFLGVRRRLRELSRRSPITFRFHRVERSLLEGMICRGDRRVAASIQAAWRNGARMDSWDEYFDYARWQAAFEQTGIDAAFYLRQLPLDSPLSWSHIAGPHDEDILRKEYIRMMSVLTGGAEGGWR
jgi:radical SAM family uncharacterized protein